MRLRTLAFCTLVMSALMSTTPVRAEGIEVHGVSFAELPKNTDITVETFDDAKENQDLKKLFEDELRSAGYTVKDNARLILSFETRDTSGKWSGGGPNRLIEMRNTDNHTGKDAPEVRLNIFDSQRGGILNPKRDQGIIQVAPGEFRIDVAIEDRTNGRRLWQAWSSTTDNAGAEDTAFHRSMVQPIIEKIGTNTQN